MEKVQRVQKKTSTMSLTISSSASSHRELSSSALLSSSASSHRELSSTSAPFTSYCASSASSSSASSSSVLTQRLSSLVQPVCVSPSTTPGAPFSPQYSGSRGAPSFVKCLHDVSSVKGQLVVLECRLRGTPPMQVLWYREEEQILDSDDFRILRKKASSASVPEELCTLVITEAFPEDSGVYKCVALNSYGSVSCAAVLEVYNDLEEQMELESLRQQESSSLHMSSIKTSEEEFPSVLPEPEPEPEPEWPESPPEESLITDFAEPQPPPCSEDSSVGQRSEVVVTAVTPSPPPPPSPPAEVEPTQTKEKGGKLFTPSKLTFTSGSRTMDLSDLPSFTPSSFPSTGFNYERPRHFIQSQPSFQAPSYDVALQIDSPTSPALSSPLSPTGSTPSQPANLARATAEVKTSVSQNKVSQVSHNQISHSDSRSLSQTQSQFQSMTLNDGQLQSNGTSKSSSLSSQSSSLLSPSSSSLLSPSSSTLLSPSSSTSPLTRTVRSSIILTPSSPSATMGKGSATLPANQDNISAPAAYLCSVLPGSKSPSRLPLMPSRMPLGGGVPAGGGGGVPHAGGGPPGFQAMPLSPSLSRSSLSPQQQQQQNLQNQVQPSVVSLPASYKPTPTILPKPILKKTIAPRPSSARSTEEDIQGSKDALIQDLEKKLRSKEARRRTGQKLSYEERMARRLLGPDNATYMFDQELSDSMDQPDSPEGRHTGGLWGRHHSGSDEKTNEGPAIQEKCYAPRFLQIPPDLTVEEGRFCRIDFKVGGLPTPDVSWYLDGKAIRLDDYHKMLVCEKGLHSFIIEIVTVHHAGVYECVARNRAGESRFSMRLDVIAQEALRPPTFVQKMLNSRALEGDTVRLECKVDASPPPQLFWKKDKDMLRIDPNRMSLYQDGSGRQCLLIERVVKSDAGWYTLSAINEAGMSTCNARLDISSRTTPLMKTAPPASKTLKLLSSLSHVPVNTENPGQHTAPLYESEEL
ncbi:hypothetical protein NQD34_007771 [Periophthalmus magnuspinnatus]|nr:hypothetical protein NQD34_007771 [Periophthalmus magnuspinnatus]